MQLENFRSYLKKKIFFKIIYFIFLISIIFSNPVNYNSIEYCISSYWKMMPNISRPFDNKDLFYDSINEESLLIENYPSISHANRKNKKVKSIKKLKQFSTKNKVGENKGTYVIYQSHHNRDLISPVVVELNWYKNQAYIYNQRIEFDDRTIVLNAGEMIVVAKK